MSEPSGPVNGQNRVVEGLVTTGGAAGYRKGTNAEAVAGSAYNALDQVVTLGTTPIVGALTETAPATDTASSGLNGRLQRIAQRLTSLIALLPAALGAGGGLKVDGSGTPLPVSGTVTANVGTGTLAVSATSLPLPTGAATATLQGGGLPAALGQGTMAQSLKVAVASDQSAIPTGSTAVVVSATPTLDTAAYASGDSLHTAVIEFTNAVGARLSGWVDKMVIVDAALQSQPCELWLFSSTVTPAAANAAHSISDADAAKCIGVISSGPYAASALNSVSVAKGVNLPIKTAATSLFGILVTRGTPTYAAGSLTVSLQIAQD